MGTPEEYAQERKTTRYILYNDCPSPSSGQRADLRGQEIGQFRNCFNSSVYICGYILGYSVGEKSTFVAIEVAVKKYCTKIPGFDVLDGNDTTSQGSEWEHLSTTLVSLKKRFSEGIVQNNTAKKTLGDTNIYVCQCTGVCVIDSQHEDRGDKEE